MYKFLKNKCRLTEKSIITIAEEVLNTGYKLKAKTAGASMYPIVRKGDIVTIKPVPFTRINIGDIAAFINESASSIILHRVLYKDVNQFFTRGDISIKKNCDLPVERNRFLGILDEIQRGNRIIQLNGKFYNRYKFIAVFLSRHIPWVLFIPAVIVRTISTPKLFFCKSLHWFRKIFFK